MQRLAFDIRGTFTDYGLHDESTGRIRIWKVPTTREPESSVEATLAQKIAEGELTFDQACSVVHATTVECAAGYRARACEHRCGT
jgi:N-methylhydantoinase A/oxoprolinase/acetone carboxylase beta subunit